MKRFLNYKSCQSLDFSISKNLLFFLITFLDSSSLIDKSVPLLPLKLGMRGTQIPNLHAFLDNGFVERLAIDAQTEHT